MRAITDAALAAALLLTALSTPAAARAQAAAQDPLDTVRARVPDDPEQRKSYEAMVNFVHANASVAGADSACEAALPELLRQCTVFTLNEWDRITGLARLRDQRLFKDITELVWVDTYDRAKAVQGGPDATSSCSSVEARIRALPLMKGLCIPDAQMRASAQGSQGGSDLPPLHVN
jgi:hypothetical protein